MVRHGRSDRGARGGAGLKPAGTTTALLRPALEAAVAVAREGERSSPSVPAPAALRRYVSFARLPDPALEVAKRVLDEDEEFRARVADGVDEQLVGRAGWIYLTRPEGWEAELDELRREAAAQHIAAREERAEREALRRLAGAEAAAARAQASAVAAASEAERLRADLDRERSAAAAAAAEVDQLRAELARTAEDRTAAIRRLKGVEATLAERNAELRRVRHDLRMAQAELGQGDLAPIPAAPGPAAPAPAADEKREPPLDRNALVVAVSDAFQALQELTHALGSASDLLAPPDEGHADRRSPAEAQGRRATRGRRPRRRPAPLPPGVLEESPEAAEHLVRASGALLLVDGYNISHAQWYGLPLGEQRARLLDACAELHARCGTEIEVIFDGEGDDATSSAQPRAAVRHRFTAAGEEADDAILARVEEEPPGRPVLVASSDRRVRDGARERGANVLGARQVLAVLRR